MTTIAVKIDRVKGTISIAADNQITASSSYRESLKTCCRPNQKLVLLRNGMAIAMTGSIGEMNLFVAAAESVAESSSEDRELKLFLRDCYEQYINLPGYEKSINSMLIVANGKAYEVDDRYSIMPINEYSALGSGSAFALAALYMGAGAKEAVEVAANFDLYTNDHISFATLPLHPVSRSAAA